MICIILHPLPCKLVNLVNVPSLWYAIKLMVPSTFGQFKGLVLVELDALEGSLTISCKVYSSVWY